MWCGTCVTYLLIEVWTREYVAPPLTQSLYFKLPDT